MGERVGACCGMPPPAGPPGTNTSTVTCAQRSVLRRHPHHGHDAHFLCSCEYDSICVAHALPHRAPTRPPQVGAGVLGLPSAMSWLGWVAGPILLTFFYGTALWTSRLLADVYCVAGIEHARYHHAVENLLVGRGFSMHD